MPNRRVSVGLEADVADFITGMEAAQRELGKVDREAEGLDRSLNKIPLDSAKAAASMKLLTGDVRDLSTNIDNVGDRSTAMTLLDNRIRSTRAEVRKLADEFVKTGDIDIFRKLSESQGNLNALTSIRKKLASALDDGSRDGGRSGATTFASAFQGGLINAFDSLPPQLKAAVAEAIVVSVVAASAPIGAAINGALLAGVGLGGLGLGIAGQASNPVVKEAFTKLGANLKAELATASSSFATPLVNSAHTLDKALSGVLNRLEPRFEGLSHSIEPLTQGLAGLLTNAGPGFADALKAAGPILDKIAGELPGLGNSLSRFFALIADGSDGATKGIDLMFLAVETLVVGIGGLIDGLSHLYDWFLAPGEQILEWWDRLDGKQTGVAHSLNQVSDAAQTVTPDLEALSGALSKTTVTADTLAGSMVNKVFNALMSVDQANLSVAESLTRVGESLKQNGKSLDIHTAKGQANREAILGAVNANMQLYQAQISSGVSAEEAGKKYDDNTAALERQLTKAGYTKQQIQDLIGKYKSIPGKVSTEIAMQGLTNAINGLVDLYKKIYNIPDGHFNIYGAYIGPHIGSVGGKEGPGKYALGGIRHADEGLLVPPRDPGTVLFGEPQTGGEALIPLRGIAPSRAMSLAQAVGNSYGFDVAPKWSGMGYGSVPVTKVVVVGGDLRVTGPNTALGTMLQEMARHGQLQFTVKAA